MNLREPKKKRTKLKPQLPFPIPLNETQEWPVYTAHLTDVGSCIIEPEEMTAVHSMVKIYFIKVIFHTNSKINISVYRGFLAKDHCRVVIHRLAKRDMEYHQLFGTDSGFVDKIGSRMSKN